MHISPNCGFVCISLQCTPLHSSYILRCFCSCVRAELCLFLILPPPSLSLCKHRQTTHTHIDIDICVCVCAIVWRGVPSSNIYFRPTDWITHVCNYLRRYCIAYIRPSQTFWIVTPFFDKRNFLLPLHQQHFFGKRKIRPFSPPSDRAHFRQNQTLAIFHMEDQTCKKNLVCKTDSKAKI